jgi:hypothetical protein
VTKLSLLLKVLEGENAETLGKTLKLLHERALPDLGRNIQCGNSLIGTDFYDDHPLETLSEEERYRINAFDWETAFPEIMKAGGFDAVIGNPPYVQLETATLPSQALSYLRGRWVSEYKADLFHLFIERGITLLREGGHFGYITPNPWLTLKHNTRLREYVLDHTAIDEIVLFEDRVFEKAEVHTLLVFLTKGLPREEHKVRVRRPSSPLGGETLETTTFDLFPQTAWRQALGYVMDTRLVGPAGKLVTALLSSHLTLGSIVRVSLGCQAYNRSKHTPEEIRDRVFHARQRLSSEYLPELAGKDVGRYYINRVRGQWIRYGPWLHDYRTMDWLQGPRVLVREIPGPPPYRLQATYTEDTYCNYKTILNVNPSQETEVSMKYVVGLLNSRVISFLYPYISNKTLARTFPRVSVADLKKLPVPTPDLSTPRGLLLHEQVVGTVDLMLSLQERLLTVRTSEEKTVLQRQIDATGRKIDELVYELYGLTDEEIRIVEEAKS